MNNLTVQLEKRSNFHADFRTCPNALSGLGKRICELILFFLALRVVFGVPQANGMIVLAEENPTMLEVSLDLDAQGSGDELPRRCRHFFGRRRGSFHAMRIRSKKKTVKSPVTPGMVAVAAVELTTKRNNTVETTPKTEPEFSNFTEPGPQNFSTVFFDTEEDRNNSITTKSPDTTPFIAKNPKCRSEAEGWLKINT